MLFFIFISGSRVHAQEDDAEPAILLSGPRTVKGIDFLPPNAVSAEYGVYSFRENRVAVYFVREEVYLPGDTAPLICGSYSLSELEGTNLRIFLYEDEAGWKVFISFEKVPEDPCLFIGAFLRRFRYFLGIAKDESSVSFPAVLEYQ